MATLETRKMLAVAVDAADSKKAEEIRILELDPTESSLTDYFLICSGTNDRQNVAIADEIELRLKHEFGTLPNSVEGRRQGEWVLMDYVDFIVHVFLPERRAFYGLERLKKTATSISLEDLNAELRGKVKQLRIKTPSKKAETKQAAPSAAKKAAKSTSKKTVKKAAANKTVAKKAVVKKTAAKKSATKVATKKIVAKTPTKKAAKNSTSRSSK